MQAFSIMSVDQCAFFVIYWSIYVKTKLVFFLYLCPQTSYYFRGSKCYIDQQIKTWAQGLISVRQWFPLFLYYIRVYPLKSLIRCKEITKFSNKDDNLLFLKNVICLYLSDYLINKEILRNPVRWGGSPKKFEEVTAIEEQIVCIHTPWNLGVQ